MAFTTSGQETEWALFLQPPEPTRGWCIITPGWIGAARLLVCMPSVQSMLNCLLVSSLPVSCPFHDAYYLAYNNNSGGFCGQPPSYVSPCASHTHLHFRLQKCAHVAYTYRRGKDHQGRQRHRGRIPGNRAGNGSMGHGSCVKWVMRYSRKPMTDER